MWLKCHSCGVSVKDPGAAGSSHERYGHRVTQLRVAKYLSNRKSPKTGKEDLERTVTLCERCFGKLESEESRHNHNRNLLDGKYQETVVPKWKGKDKPKRNPRDSPPLPIISSVRSLSAPITSPPSNTYSQTAPCISISAASGENEARNRAPDLLVMRTIPITAYISPAMIPQTCILENVRQDHTYAVLSPPPAPEQPPLGVIPPTNPTSGHLQTGDIVSTSEDVATVLGPSPPPAEILKLLSFLFPASNGGRAPAELPTSIRLGSLIIESCGNETPGNGVTIQPSPPDPPLAEPKKRKRKPRPKKPTPPGVMTGVATRKRIYPVITCQTCGRGILKHNFRTHQRLHTGERPYFCFLCGKIISHISSLYRHVREIHNVFDEPHQRDHHLYRCPTCGKFLRDRCRLWVHIFLKHVICNKSEEEREADRLKVVAQAQSREILARLQEGLHVQVEVQVKALAESQAAQTELPVETDAQATSNPTTSAAPKRKRSRKMSSAPSSDEEENES